MSQTMRDKLPYYILSPNLLKGLQKWLSDYKPSGPSTGAIGIGLMLHLCKNVDLYGFESVSGIKNATTTKAHYWDSTMDLQRREEMQIALPIDREQIMWNKLAIKNLGP